VCVCVYVCNMDGRELERGNVAAENIVVSYIIL
jgi:hypothetical protein